MFARGSSRFRAFTLVEAMVVVILMSIIAVTVLPALGNLDEARRGAAVDEVARVLTHARSLAMASGRPSGVSFELGAETIRVMTIETTGGAPTPAADALGQPEPAVALPDLYAGVELVGITHGDGSTASGVVWFGFDGVPRLRDAGGALVGPFTQDAVVELTGSRTVSIRMGTGLVE